jgi:hypothetical protein
MVLSSIHPPSKNHGADLTVIQDGGEVSVNAHVQIQVVIRRDIYSLRHWVPKDHTVGVIATAKDYADTRVHVKLSSAA